MARRRDPFTGLPTEPGEPGAMAAPTEAPSRRRLEAPASPAPTTVGLPPIDPGVSDVPMGVGGARPAVPRRALGPTSRSRPAVPPTPAPPGSTVEETPTETTDETGGIDVAGRPFDSTGDPLEDLRRLQLRFPAWAGSTGTENVRTIASALEQAYPGRVRAGQPNAQGLVDAINIDGTWYDVIQAHSPTGGSPQILRADGSTGGAPGGGAPTGGVGPFQGQPVEVGADPFSQAIMTGFLGMLLEQLGGGAGGGLGAAPLHTSPFGQSPAAALPQSQQLIQQLQTALRREPAFRVGGS